MTGPTGATYCGIAVGSFGAKGIDVVCAYRDLDFNEAPDWDVAVSVIAGEEQDPVLRYAIADYFETLSAQANIRYDKLCMLLSSPHGKATFCTEQSLLAGNLVDSASTERNMEMAAAGRTLFVFAPPTPAADSAGRLLVTAQSACRAFEVNRDLCVLQTSAMMVLEPKISACEGLPDVDSEGESQLRYFSCALDLFRDQPCTVSNTAVQLTSAIAAACGDAPLAANPTVVVPQVTSKLWTSSRKWQTVTVPAGDGISISNYDSYNSPRALQLLFNFSSSLGDVFAIEAAFSNSFLEQGWSVSKRLLDHSAVVVEYSGLGGKRVSAFFMGGSSVGGAGGTPTMLTLKWLSPVDDGVAAGPVAAIVPPQDMAEGLPAASPPGGQTDAMQGSESAAEGSKSETIAETSKSVWLLPPNDTGNWFVLVGTFASGESAAAAISDLAERGWIGVQRPARLHSPTSPGFIVVIGTNLSSDNADALIAEAESQIPGLTKFQRQPAPAR